MSDGILTFCIVWLWILGEMLIFGRMWAFGMVCALDGIWDSAGCGHPALRMVLLDIKRRLLFTGNVLILFNS